MKQYLLILLSVFLITGCTEKIWEDHDDPRIYIPKSGFSVNKAWLLDGNEYTIELSAYCSGIRPENRKNDITVHYSIDPSIIAEYNSDDTQEYQGQIVELPADCYTLESSDIVIPKKQNHGELNIRINLAKVKALGLGLNEIKYAIPVRLQSTSQYNLQEDEKMLKAIYCVSIDEPTFYFWDNREQESGAKTIEQKVRYGSDNVERAFRIMAYGLGQMMSEDYTLTIGVDASAVPAGGELLPENAYEMPNSVTYEKGATDAYLPVKFINNNVNFRKTYYLPVEISATSKYRPDAQKAKLMLKIQAQNDYEVDYSSVMTVSYKGLSEVSGKTTKSPVSLSEDMLYFSTMLTKYFNGADNYDYSAKYYIYYSYAIKIIPTADKNKYGVELIKTDSSITGKNWYGYQSPVTLELDPDKESYYDYDYERFYLNYRYKKNGEWVTVTEILEAK